MKLNRFTRRFLSLLTAAMMSVYFAAPAFAEGEFVTDQEELDQDDIEFEPDEPDETDEPNVTDDNETDVSMGDDSLDAPDDETAGDDPEPDEPGESDEPPVIEPAVTDAPAATEPPAATTPLPTYIPEAEHKMYAPQVINVRRGPSTDFDKIGVLYTGSEVTVIGTNGEWSAVSYGEGIGYIMTSLLSAEAPAATTTTQAPPPETTTEASPETTPESAPTETSPEDLPAMAPTEPADTEPAETEPEKTTTSEPAETTKAAASVSDGSDGGFPPLITALLCAIAAFLLIGALPVFIHSTHHKNLYKY